jgi:glycosyltransferase involved in cell wall biosynthesis
MKTAPLVSIIFPAKNEGINVKKTLDSLFSTSADIPFEVIIVDDGSSDGCCDFLQTYKDKEKVKTITTKGVGASNARNMGAQQASGDYYIFCDAHLKFEDKWIDRLLAPLLEKKTDAITPAIAAMDNRRSIGFGQTLTPALSIKWNKRQQGLFETAVLPGGCFAISRTAFEDVGGFETGFVTWGHEDVEISIKLWLFGYRCHVEPSVTVLHLFRRKHPYTVTFDEVSYNLLRMAYSHFNKTRIKKCKRLLRGRNISQIEPKLLKSGILKQREEYFKKRKYDDDWYFKKFNINF